MKGPAESGQICSVGRRKIAKKIAKNKRCYANTLRPRSRMLLKGDEGGLGGHYPLGHLRRGGGSISALRVTGDPAKGDPGGEAPPASSNVDHPASGCPKLSASEDRSRVLRFVRRLHCYYDGVRLLVPVHHRLRLLTFPMRTIPLTRH
jgi:hypothetical protein